MTDNSKACTFVIKRKSKISINPVLSFLCVYQKEKNSNNKSIYNSERMVSIYKLKFLFRLFNFIKQNLDKSIFLYINISQIISNELMLCKRRLKERVKNTFNEKINWFSLYKTLKFRQCIWQSCQFYFKTKWFRTIYQVKHLLHRHSLRLHWD